MFLEEGWLTRVFFVEFMALAIIRVSKGKISTDGKFNWSITHLKEDLESSEIIRLPIAFIRLLYHKFKCACS